MENTQSASKSPKLKLDFKDSKYATGRRKTSIAKVWLKKGSGKIYVNGNCSMNISQTKLIKCKLQDLLKLLIRLQITM